MSQKTYHKEEKDSKIYAGIGTLAFCGLLLLVMFSFVFTTQLPGSDEIGVEINLGNSDDGMGNDLLSNLSAAGGSIPIPRTSRNTDQIVTQNAEDAPALEDNTKKEKPSPTTPPTVPQPVQPKVNPNALYKGKNTGSSQGQGGNEGTTGKPGNQGKLYGSPTGTNYDGTSGHGGSIESGSGGGTGISYNLGGRGAKSLPKPAYNSKEQGVVVVTIWVNPQGKVTRAESGAKGTTISDMNLRRMAESAAKQAIFAAKPDAPDEQKGSITYRFIKQN